MRRRRGLRHRRRDPLPPVSFRQGVSSDISAQPAAARSEGATHESAADRSRRGTEKVSSRGRTKEREHGTRSGLKRKRRRSRSIASGGVRLCGHANELPERRAERQAPARWRGDQDGSSRAHLARRDWRNEVQMDARSASAAACRRALTSASSRAATSMRSCCISVRSRCWSARSC